MQVYELAFEELPKSYVFNGAKDVTAKQVQDLLALGAKGVPGRAPQQMQYNPKGNRYSWIISFLTNIVF